jgi:hypothetical protein
VSDRCLDCGANTIAIGEYYMLHDRVWLEANPGGWGMLCIGCVEERLDRRLVFADFMDVPVNRDLCSARLYLARTA